MTPSQTDSITWTPKARVLQYSPEQVLLVAAREGIGIEDVRAEHLFRQLDAPDAVAESKGNVLSTLGLNRITSLIIGAGGQAMNNAQMILGVGSTATAATAADTALGANGTAANGTVGAWYQGSDATFPTQANGLISAQSTFTAISGNAFNWNEWCWAVCTGSITPGATLASVGTSPIMINHKAPASLGGKVSGAVWVLQTSVTLS